MVKRLSLLLILSATISTYRLQAQQPDTTTYHEPYRPQEHFSPKAHWMNDPNGMVYFNHTYHLFFQYYPGGTTWGPMHWGHAVSKDLIHWKGLPIALYPDSLGYIFSGSAVVDSANTSEFGKNGKIPLVAIFTHHDPKGEKAGKNDFQNESLAYSLDGGYTWTKYKANPVLKNPGIKDFRDPKVMWFAPEKKWVMTLATQDHITFYSAPDLKTWTKESEFGKATGAHGGVWECPDLFPLKLGDKTYWILIVNLNPGGPNGGSATQYFVGQFDGNKFTAVDDRLRWLDYGPDEYAGVTWNNTGARKIFLGWMSNWQYASQVPTQKWRNAMTVPRELSLKQSNGEILLASAPVKELKDVERTPIEISGVNLKDRNILAAQGVHPHQFILKISIAKMNDYAVILSNDSGDKLIFGFDKTRNGYYIDRSKSGVVDFNPEFAKTFFAPRLTVQPNANVELIVDESSLEVFADDGLSVMTCAFFPHKPYDNLAIQPAGALAFKKITLTPLRSIW